MKIRHIVNLLVFPALLSAQDFPAVDIASKQIKAKILLPDPSRGYYRGTRFDWSGVISSLEYSGHQFFGVWFEHYDPKLHDAITGPVEEFSTGGDSSLGYADAKPGGTFVRIGVGTVTKPDNEPYQRFKTYDIVDSGKWLFRNGPDWVEFTQRLNDANGYAYTYRKTVRLSKSAPEMTIEHSLENTGTKTIDTSVYDHDFFVIDKQATGPDVVIKFPFAPKPTKDLQGRARIEGNELVYTQPLEKDQSVFTEMEGFGSSASDYDFRIENRKSGAGVRIRGDHPLEKVVFWSIRTVACPEPYIALKAEPGKTAKWTYTYDFYTFPPAP